MRNLLLIARREYIERIRTKGFAVMTVLIPLLMGGGLFSAVYFGHDRSSEKSVVAITIVTPDTQLALHLQDRLASLDPAMPVEINSPPTQDSLKDVAGQYKQGEIEGFLIVDAAAKEQAVFYGHPTAQHLREAQQVLQENAEMGHLRTPVVVQMHALPSGLAAMSPQDSSKATAYVLFFMMYFAVMMYGVNVARSISEEKTSRVFEVMLATVTPDEMMGGKVLGVGGVGLTQVFIWMAAAALLVLTPLVRIVTGVDVRIGLGPLQMAFFVLMFVLGFLLYASIAAILGAIVNSDQELGQLNMVLAMPLAFCMMVSYATIFSPNGPLATVTSLIPLCTPLLMFSRVAVAHVPGWQIVLSIVDLVLSIYAMMWIASRIYRVGILMYGKKPGLREILRWMRYS